MWCVGARLAPFLVLVTVLWTFVCYSHGATVKNVTKRETALWFWDPRGYLIPIKGRSIATTYITSKHKTYL